MGRGQDRRHCYYSGRLLADRCRAAAALEVQAIPARRAYGLAALDIYPCVARGRTEPGAGDLA